ncbi:MAG: hypothetical protein IPP73_00335 [Chitinophagaceae bacterium]|nr:hypothetical protein [Chitinophagaceae bacterium]
MLFSLEALQADYGDSLILYYGTKTKPGIIVIDGGPSGIFGDVLKPRLAAVKAKISKDEPLPLSMVMVSHLDDDHVNGVLSLVSELADKAENNEAADWSMKNIWFNSFDDIIGNIQIPAIAAIPASVAAADVSKIPGLENADESIAAVIASTGQGRKLRDLAEQLAVSVNNPFKKLAAGKSNLVRSDLGGKKSAIPWEKIKITVLHPNEKRLNELQKQWDKDLKTAKAKGDPKIMMASLTNTDKSPFNLSSIVCLVELSGKKNTAYRRCPQ